MHILFILQHKDDLKLKNLSLRSAFGIKISPEEFTQLHTKQESKREYVNKSQGFKHNGNGIDNSFEISRDNQKRISISNIKDKMEIHLYEIIFSMYDDMIHRIIRI